MSFWILNAENQAEVQVWLLPVLEFVGIKFWGIPQHHPHPPTEPFYRLNRD